MNHIPYEDWLLSEEELDPAQQAELKEHLAGCESCRKLAQAWQSVAVTIQKAPEMAPAPGFTNRWRERLIEEKVKRQRHLTWLILALCLGGALASLTGLAIPLFENPISGVTILTSLFQGVSQLLSTGEAAFDAIRGIFVRLPLGVSLLIWIAGACTLCFWSLIWFAFVWRLPHLRRSQNEAFE